MSAACPNFVKWREEFVSQERGSRVVHFYLEDSNGDSHLTVVGTERSLRHMLYVVTEDFCRTRFGFFDKGGLSSLKWRSRREVVDWLAQFLPIKTYPQKIAINGFCDRKGSPCELPDKDCSSDIVWSGAYWICGKQLYHYQAFCRNGTTISAHSFALIMSEEENRYLAYLEDMYEDKKGQKKVKVRWFHQNREFACPIPPPAPHPCEVFITPYSQVISVECVDDVATVLTPEDYEKCLNSITDPPAPSSTRMCFRQYSKNKFKYFDLRTLRGYFDQPAVLYLKAIIAEPEDQQQQTAPCNMQRRLYAANFNEPICGGKADGGAKKLKFVGPANQVGLPPCYSVGEKVEVLSQDSGIRGCWFRCTVLEISHKTMRVRYDDVSDADDCGNLEEWILAFRVAEPDKLGMRCRGRPMVRPTPPESNMLENVIPLPGTAVDAWWNDGWWEGVLVASHNSGHDNLQIYFPGEDILMGCQTKDVRISKEWVRNQWVEIEARPDLLSRIPSMNPGMAGPTKRADSDSSAMSAREEGATATAPTELQTELNEEDKEAVAHSFSLREEIDDDDDIINDEDDDDDDDDEPNRRKRFRYEGTGEESTVR